jgi:hypothetical protein
MIHAPRFLTFALASVLVAVSGPVASEEDEIHFCQDADGNIVLQTDLCPEPVDTVDKPGPPPPTTPTRSSAPPVVRASAAVGTMASASVRRSTSGWTVIPRSRNTPRAPGPTLGKQSFPTSLTGVPRPSSPNFASPELTWRTFVGAIESGDHTVARTCLTPAALERLGPDAGSIPLGDLRSMLSMFTRIENGGELGPFWSIHGVRANQRPKWIFFEQTASGEWKIAGI